MHVLILLVMETRSSVELWYLGNIMVTKIFAVMVVYPFCGKLP